MAIKKEVQPGDVIAFRKIYGTGNFRHATYQSTPYISTLFVRPDNTTYRELNDSTSNPYCVIRLKLKTRRARSKGIVVTSEMLPILKSLDIKTIPLEVDGRRPSFIYVNRHIRENGFFSLSYRRTTSTRGIYYSDDSNPYRTVDSTVEHVVPTESDYAFNDYYIAVGVEADMVASSDDYVPVHVSESVKKYTDDIGNSDYSVLLNKDILEVEV